MLALAVPFIAGMMGIHALNGIVYYNNNETMPGRRDRDDNRPVPSCHLRLGLITPLRVVVEVPALAYIAVTLLWPLTP